MAKYLPPHKRNTHRGSRCSDTVRFERDGGVRRCAGVSGRGAECVFSGPAGRPCTWLLLPPTDDSSQLSLWDKFAQEQWEMHYKGEIGHQDESQQCKAMVESDTPLAVVVETSGESQQCKAMVESDTALTVVAASLKTVHKELPPKKDEPNKVAVEEEVIRAREDRYMAKEKRRQRFCMLTKPHTARCEFGEEIAEDLYQDIAQDIEEFLQDGCLADKAEAHVRANVNPGAGGCCPLCSLPRQNDSTPTWTAQNRVGFSSRPCPECNAMMQRHRQ